MRFGHELVDFRRDGGDVLHTIVHVEHLPTTQQLAPDGGGDLRVLVSADVGEHRQTILRRRGQAWTFRGYRLTAVSNGARDSVADRLSTSTLVRNALSVSLCSTPKRCSSSMMTSPRSLNLIFGLSSLCVPMTTSTEPSSSPLMVSLISLVVWNRLMAATFTGKPSKRSVKSRNAVARAVWSARARPPAWNPAPP